MAFLTMERLRQPVAAHGNGFAYLSRFRLTSTCHGLPPVAPAGLHKGSILRCLLWLRSSESLARGRCCGKEVVLPLQALEAVPTP
jgi:hypothetical protein